MKHKISDWNGPQFEVRFEKPTLLRDVVDGRGRLIDRTYLSFTKTIAKRISSHPKPHEMEALMNAMVEECIGVTNDYIPDMLENKYRYSTFETEIGVDVDGTLYEMHAMLHLHIDYSVGMILVLINIMEQEEMDPYTFERSEIIYGPKHPLGNKTLH